jgi:hypothetical protein
VQGFEQGPIRPPSEAHSLLVRINRNCPWNRCAFCPVYKGERFSTRTADEVLADLDALRRAYGPDGPRTVFLQDANPLLLATGELVRILEGIRERFPHVSRVTAYARSRTLARRPPEELARLRAAGLDRLHVGLESGSDEVLSLVDKGATRADCLEAGRRAKAAGFELSCYVMPGLGGRTRSVLHADETASALVQMRPDFVRLRTTAVVPGSGLARLQAEGRFEPCGEVELVAEIRRLVEGLGELRTRLESDHVLNLLMELEGELPGARPALLALCDRFLGLPAEERARFVLARRLGFMGRLEDYLRPEVRAELVRALEAEGLGAEALARAEEIAGELRTRCL